MPEYKRPQAADSHEPSERLLQWFDSRGISKETVRESRVTEGREWMPQLQAPTNTVQFNYYLNNELINVKYRTGDKKFKLVAGAELLPWNIDAIKGQPDCIITEGEMDAMSFIEVGLRSVVSVPNGAGSNLNYLDRYIDDYFEDKQTIYIAVDTDQKGRMLRDQLLTRFGAERCRILDYGDDCKDANELLVKHGREALEQAYHHAQYARIDDISCADDVRDQMLDLFDGKEDMGVTVGLDNLDDVCRFEPQRLCIVTGIPGAGKSELIDELCVRLNVRHGWRTIYFSPENSPLRRHIQKIARKLAGCEFSRLTMQPHQRDAVLDHIQQEFSFVTPEADFSVENVLEKAACLQRRRGAKVLVIDPFNRLSSRERSGNETEFVRQVLSRLAEFAKRHDMLVILMAHPSKRTTNAQGEYERPTMYSISGSANFYNMADYGFVVHRSYVTDVAEVHVEKVKFSNLGRPGMVYLNHHPASGRFAPSYMSDNGLVHTPHDTANYVEQLRQARLATEAANLPQLF